ncbi:hypothetical protein IMSAGC013_01798 [Lachnospiraceae bacterium]|nr:hypothetical protein IMSAGC013_01798 [Lachnospiraceae bacterium]
MVHRTKKMTFRLSEEEYRQIKEKVEESGLSQQKFLLKTALEKEIFHIKEFQTLIFHVKKIGININQIARNCNGTGAISNDDMIEIKEGVNMIWQLLNQSKIHTQA